MTEMAAQLQRDYGAGAADEAHSRLMRAVAANQPLSIEELTGAWYVLIQANWVESEGSTAA